MPSSPNYVRDYKQEAKTESSTRKAKRRNRLKARRTLQKAGIVKKGDIRKRLKKISRTPGGRAGAGLMAVAGVMINAIDKAKEEDKKSVRVGGMTFTVSPPKSGDRPSKDKMLEEQKKRVKKAREKVYGR